MEGERGTPIVTDERDVFGEGERIQPGVEVAGVVDEVITAARVAPGSAHADQVRRQATGLLGQRWDDVAPEVGRSRVAMQEDQGWAAAFIDVGHLRIEDGDTLPGAFVAHASRLSSGTATGS